MIYDREKQNLRAATGQGTPADFVNSMQGNWPGIDIARHNYGILNDSAILFCQTKHHFKGTF